MDSHAYYNEFNADAAEWLRNLIAEGLIAPGDVDTRSIEDVLPSDLDGYTQCHFFAGIAGWSLALRLAGWPDDRPVWTGSCPCQPFSAAGKGAGFSDERHLWPAFHHLIRQRLPAIVFGEQVASADGLGWLDLVRTDLEGEGYAVGAADLCAAGIGAPHIRQRLYWVADANVQHERPARNAKGAGNAGGGVLLDGMAHSSSTRLEGRDEGPLGVERQAAERGGCAGGLAHNDEHGCTAQPCTGLHDSECDAESCRSVGGLAYAQHRAQHGDAGAVHCPQAANASNRRDDHRIVGGCEAGRPGPTNGHWRDADWLFCRDGRWRPVEPGTFPLAHGLPKGLGSLPKDLQRLARMAGLDGASLKRAKAHRISGLRGAGNAIVPELAAVFVRAST